MRYWRLWKYKNLTFLFLSIVLGIIFYNNKIINDLLINLGSFGYIGAIVGGMLFVSSFTVGTGASILLILTKTLSPLEIAILGGLGGVVGDFTVFRFIRSTFVTEIEPIYKKLGGSHLTRMLNSEYLRWILPVIGALIIAFPFPDEFGIMLMGISKIKTYQFVLLSFLLDTIGVFLFLSVFSIFEFNR